MITHDTLRKQAEGLAAMLSRLFTSLNHLDVSYSKIASLQGIETMPHLISLNIAANELTDINGIEKCTSLEMLVLSDNQVIDLSPLEKLTNLTYLNISGNKNLHTLKPLESLTNLKELDISKCNIPDLSPLYKLHKLEKFYCTLLDESQRKTLQQQLPGVKINSYGYDDSVSYR